VLSGTEFVDYYDFLMVSPQADKAMLEWAVRLMLTRYGPKTPETADAAKYETTKLAYRALIDPVKREEYNQLWLKHKGQHSPAAAVKRERRSTSSRPGNRSLEKICIELEATEEDVRLQLRLRQAVLSALYDALITDPRNPERGRAEIAKTIHCRIDDLEFPVWFLRERGFIKTSNAGDYSITSDGVQWVEAGGVPHLAPKASPKAVEELPTGSRRAG
jgi:curved DNA-binding protein